MAEVLLRHRLAGLGVDARVSSAGLLDDGMAPTPDALAVMAALGHDTSGHRSRHMTAEALSADLLLGLARRHVREMVTLSPSAWPRAFTLKEFVRRAGAVGPRAAGQPFGEWVAAVHGGRSRADLLRSSSEDDVADPIGKPRAFYERNAAEISGLVDELVELGWASEAAQATGSGTAGAAS